MNRSERRALARKARSRKKLTTSAIAIGSLVSGNVGLVAPVASANGIDFAGPTCNVSTSDEIVAAGIDADCTTINVQNSISLGATVQIDHSVTIQGDVTIDGASSRRIFAITSPNVVVTLTGLTLTNGDADYGGAIWSNQYNVDLFLNNVEVSDNYAYNDGGAIYLSNGSIVLSGTNTFGDNESADAGGAIFLASGNLTMSGTNTFRDNLAFNEGGALLLDDGNLTMSGTNTFLRNVSTYDEGGAIYLYEGDLTMSGTNTFTDNSAFDEGGAIYLEFGNLTMSGTNTFLRNVSTDEEGGAMEVDGDVTISGVAKFIDNASDEDGGAIFVDETLTITSDSIVEFDRNEAGLEGGAISARGDVNIYGTVTFTDNTSLSEQGGAIYTTEDVLIQGKGVYFGGNTAGTHGGAIYAKSQVTVENSTFFENTADTDQADGVAGEGGAIFAGDDSTVMFTTFVNNETADPVDGQDVPGENIYVTGEFLAEGSVATLQIFGNVFASNLSGRMEFPLLGVGGGVGTAEIVDRGGNLFTSNNEPDVTLHSSSKMVTFSSLNLTTPPSIDTSNPNYNQTPVIPISQGSSAIDVIDLAQFPNIETDLGLSGGSLTNFVDQRGVTRMSLYDAGAFEFGNAVVENQVFPGVFEEIKVVPKVVLPSQPTQLATKRQGRRSLVVQWRPAVSAGSGRITGYEIYRNGMLIARVSDKTLKYRDRGLDPRQSYSYQVVTVASQGKSIKTLRTPAIFPRR